MARDVNSEYIWLENRYQNQPHKNIKHLQPTDGDSSLLSFQPFYVSSGVALFFVHAISSMQFDWVGNLLWTIREIDFHWIHSEFCWAPKNCRQKISIRFHLQLTHFSYFFPAAAAYLLHFHHWNSFGCT